MTYRGTAILGSTHVHVEQLEGNLRARNPKAPHLAELYVKIAPQLGVRGDIAFAQAMLETNYLRYGGSVQPWQNNFAGLGATGPGETGAVFASAEEGVLAHLQHLFAYASKDPLPAGMVLVDPRFQLVQRDTARYLGELNGRWAVDPSYGQKIDHILGEILMSPSAEEPYNIRQTHLDPNSQNRPGSCSGSACWRGVQGIVVHRTASPTQNAEAIRSYFNYAPDGRYASSQFVLDDQEILQLMPIGEIAYHTVGKNITHLGIETCEHNWGAPAWNESYRKLVWLTAYLVRVFGLTVADVTGHFWWDPVNRPYDPTRLGWKPADGKATGLFDWNQFVADVQVYLTCRTQPPVPPEPLIPPKVDVVVKRVVQDACTTGVLLDSTTYVPVRPFTQCLSPEATVRWEDQTQRVIVELSATTNAVPSPERQDGAGVSMAGPRTALPDITTESIHPARSKRPHHMRKGFLSHAGYVERVRQSACKKKET